jgi:tape measure domain-containing protein
MSNSIDERVVEMKFDNAQFERGVQTTLRSLEALKKGLNLEGATKGLNNVQAAGNRFSLAHIANGVDSISSRFSAMSVVGVTALATIANKAVQTGLTLTRSLTVDPIRAGLQEYETNLNSIQTILSNTSTDNTTLKQVTDALDLLNAYSDKTIYNFSQMARNIGTFTAAGVKLDTSVNAIKGIANLAAISGSSADQASTAMYQLSQALAAGKVSLMDWNSIVNAGMGGKVFQQSLMETARVHGVAIDTMVKEEGSFRETLKNGWLTSEILTETLNKFTGDLTAKQLKAMGYNDQQIAGILKMGKTAQDAATKVKTVSQLISTLQEAAGSGWAKTWQIIFGDFDEAKTLFTDVSNVLGGFISASANARNKVLGDWKALGGRQVIIDSIANAFHALLSIIRPIKNAFRDIFPPTTGAQLYNLSVAILNFSKGLELSGETAKKLRRTFAGVFAIFGIGWEVVKEGVKTFAKLFGLATEGSGDFLDLTARIGDWLVALLKAIRSGDDLSKFFGHLGDVLAIPIKLIRALAHFIGVLFDAFDGGPAGDAIAARFEPLGALGKLIAAVWSKVISIMDDVWSAFSPVADKLSEFFSSIGVTIQDSLLHIDFSTFLDAINTGLFAALVLSLKSFLKNFNIGQQVGGGILGTIKQAFGGLNDTLVAMQTNLKANTLIKIAAAVALLTASVVALSLIDSAALTKALTAITAMFIQLGVALAIFTKISGGAGFLKMPFVAASLILLSTAILILAAAVKTLSDLDWEELAKGLVGVGGLLTALALFSKFAQTSKSGLIAAPGLIALAIAVKILASAVKDFADLSWEGIAKGLAALTGVLGAVAIFTQTTGNAAQVIASAAALAVISVAVKILANALKDFSDMSWGEMAKGLVGMAGALVVIAGALAIMPPSTLLSAVSLVLVAGALKVLSSVLQDMGGMSWMEIAKGLVTLAGSLAVIAAGLYLMTGALAGAAALVIVAGSLALMGPVLEAFGKMSLAEIGKSLLMLAGVFVVLGLAGIVLTPVVPTLLALGIAVALLGAGMLAAGAGLLLFAAGLTAVSIAGAAGAAALVGIVSALLGMIPMIAKGLGLVIVGLAQGIASAGPAIVMALTTVILSLIQAIITLAPKLGEGILVLVQTILRVLVGAIPAIAQAGFQILIGFLTAISSNIGRVVTVATSIIVNFLNALSKNLPRIIQAGINLIISFVEGLARGIRQNSDRMGRAGADLAMAIVDGMIGGLTAGVGRVVEAAGGLAKSAIDAAKNILGISSPSKEFHAIGKFSAMGAAQGLEKYASVVGDAAETVGHEAINSLRKSISGLSSVVDENMDVNPKITPVLDLTQITKDSKLIDSVIGTPTIPIEATYSGRRATAISASYQPPSTAELLAAVPSKTEVNYNQYNTSPKSLNEVEIYRQTKNQISTLKGALQI